MAEFGGGKQVDEATSRSIPNLTNIRKSQVWKGLRSTQEKKDVHIINGNVDCRFFELGVGRTGSRSVYSAARQLGICSRHGFLANENWMDDAIVKDLAGRIDFLVYDGCDYSGQIAAIHWERLADDLPEAKFILTGRPVTSWIESCIKRNKKGYGHVIKMASGEVRFLWLWWLKLFGTIRFSKKLFEDGYTKHTKTIRERFADEPHRLLELNVFQESDDVLWGKLAGFLGVEPPNTPFPKTTRPIRKRG